MTKTTKTNAQTHKKQKTNTSSETTNCKIEIVCTGMLEGYQVRQLIRLVCRVALTASQIEYMWPFGRDHLLSQMVQDNVVLN